MGGSRRSELSSPLSRNNLSRSENLRRQGSFVVAAGRRSRTREEHGPGYDRFLAAAAAGRKQQAAQNVAAFVASFASDVERETWTREFLASHAYGKRVRHEIYARVVFPVLLAGASRGDPWSLYWLAGTAQNHYSDQRLGERLSFKTELDLLKDAYAIEPGQDEVRRVLLAAVLAFFAHADHEWPAVILWGMDGATPAQCDGLLKEIHFARTLDAKGNYGELIGEFESKVRAYQERLLQDGSASGYPRM